MTYRPTSNAFTCAGYGHFCFMPFNGNGGFSIKKPISGGFFLEEQLGGGREGKKEENVDQMVRARRNKRIQSVNAYEMAKTA